MSAIEKEKYKGYKIELHHDFDPLNPREDYDNFGTMVCFHSRLVLGDKHKYSVEDLKEIIESDDYFTLPLYIYEHGGVTMSTGEFSCSWDSGQVGYIIVSKEAASKEFNNLTGAELEKKSLDLLKGEVKTYDYFLTGQVYGYIVKDNLGKEVESCWGYLGESNYCIQEARRVVDYLVKQNQEDLEANEFDNHYGLA